MDSTDIKILEVLQRDGRISMKDLGNLVNLTSPAVSERVRRLEDRGVIKGYTAIVDPNLLGRTLHAMIEVSMTTASHRAFKEFVKTENAIIECHHLTGNSCMTVKVMVKSTTELEKLIGKIQQIGGTKTSIILSTPLEGKSILP